jgi:hypothetical protein
MYLWYLFQGSIRQRTMGSSPSKRESGCFSLRQDSMGHGEVKLPGSRLRFSKEQLQRLNLHLTRLEQHSNQGESKFAFNMNNSSRAVIWKISALFLEYQWDELRRVQWSHIFCFEGICVRPGFSRCAATWRLQFVSTSVSEFQDGGSLYSVLVVATKQETDWLRGLSPRANYTYRRLSAKLVPTFADKGCRVVSAADPYGRILDFRDWTTDRRASIISIQSIPFYFV